MASDCDLRAEGWARMAGMYSGRHDILRTAVSTIESRKDIIRRQMDVKLSVKMARFLTHSAPATQKDNGFMSPSQPTNHKWPE